MNFSLLIQCIKAPRSWVILCAWLVGYAALTHPYLYQGYQYYQTQQRLKQIIQHIPELIHKLEMLYRAKPQASQAILIAKLYMQQKQFDQARHFAMQAYRLDPHRPETWYLAALLTSDPKIKLQMAHQILEKNPEDTIGLLSKAQAYRWMGKIAQSNRLWARLKQQTQDPDLLSFIDEQEKKS